MGYNTVSQLIDRLREFPDDAIVLVKDQSTNSFQYFDGIAVREFDQQKNICIIDITANAAKISLKALDRGWRPNSSDNKNKELRRLLGEWINYGTPSELRDEIEAALLR